MTMRHISEALDGVLMGLGIDAKPVGAGKAWNKGAGSSRYGARRQVAAAEGRGTAAVRLVWSNPTTMSEAPSREGKPGASLIAVK